MGELEKMAKVQPVSQRIGEFLEWLEVKKDLHVCERWEEEADLERCIYLRGGFYLARASIEDLLAEFFHIDLKKVEQEKGKILEDLQKKRGGLR